MQPKFLPAVLGCMLVFVSCYSIAVPEASPAGASKGAVAFSFDDGPNPRVTPRLLETLEKYGVRGEFALLGVNAEKYPELVRRIAAGGHVIVNHGYGERFAVLLDRAAFLANLDAGERAIASALGEEVSVPPAYRPQGGFFTKTQKKLWEARGYSLAAGVIRIYDAVRSEKDKDRVVREAVQKVEAHGGGVILLHDGKNAWTTMEAELLRKPAGSANRDWIPGAVEEIILALREKGYKMGDDEGARTGAIYE